MEDELPLVEARDLLVDRFDVDTSGCAFQPFEDSSFVVLRLQATDHPGTRVGHGLVVEVHGVLSR